MLKLLIMLPNNLGDVIMTLPVLHALKVRDDSTHLSFLVEEGYDAGLKDSPYCDRIISIPRKRYKTFAVSGDWTRTVGDLRAFVDGLNREEFDRVINLSQTGYLSYIAALIHTAALDGRRFLREGNHALPDLWSQYLYAIPFARRCNTLHATDVYCRIAGVIAGDEPSGALAVSDGERHAAAAFLAAKGIKTGDRLVLLQPGAAYQSKRWPVEHFIALGKLLVNDGYTCVITGAPSERETASCIAKELGSQSCVTAGEQTFRETIATCSLVSTAVTGDTAIMHAAAALGKRVVALFGPTNPVETGPYGDGHVVMTGVCPCNPCFKTTCGSMQCLKSVDPSAVYGAVKGGTVGCRTCRVYSTRVSEGEYRLEPADGGENSYYDTSSAAAIRAIYDTVGFTTVNDAYTVETLREFSSTCTMMEKMLILFQKSGDGLYLRRFEELRQQIAATGGCTAFVNALLNIRLNSIPLLDPAAGITGSITVCRETAAEILRGIDR